MIGTALRRTGATATGAFDPTIITWQAAWWADDPLWSNPGDGNLVSTWRDLSGNLRSLDQGTAGQRPIYRSSVSGLNNRGGIEFDGSDDYLQSTTWSVTQPLTIIAVGYQTSTADGNGWFTLREIINGIFLIGRAGASNVWRLNAGSSIDSVGAPDTSKHLLRGYCNTTASVLALDETTIASGNIGTNAGTFYAVAAAQTASATPTNPTPGTFGFFGVYGGDITADGQWSTFKSQLGTYYGITLA